MKNLLSIFAVLLSVSCAYKPRMLSVFSEVTPGCFSLDSAVTSRQEIFIKARAEYAEYPGQKHLRYYFDLTDFISLDQSNCNHVEWVVKKVNTYKLYFSDTAKVKYGVQLSVDIEIYKDGNFVDEKTIKVEKVGSLYSAFTATKNKVDKSMVKLLSKAFEELAMKIRTMGRNPYY